jgi:uncharacterized membrane protein
MLNWQKRCCGGMNGLQILIRKGDDLTVRSHALRIAVSFIFVMSFNYSDSILYGQPPTNEDPRTEEYEIDSLFIALLSNGDASIDYNLVVKSDTPRTNITLFGQSIQNLTLTDYNETDIEYVHTELPNKVTVYSHASSDIHVTYTTSDLVDKQNRNWTFSFSFPDRFLLKLPSQAHIISMRPSAFLTPTGEQNLWGFGPGNVQISYVIGPLGTKEEAQASIRSVDDAIKDAKLNYNGIVFEDTSLDKAKSAFKQNKYLETITYSTNALDSLQNTTRNYVLGQQAITQAELDLQNQRNNGYDSTDGNITLTKAQSLFQAGEYAQAENLAKMASSQSRPVTDSAIGNFKNLLALILGSVAVLIVIFLIIRKKRKSSRGTLLEETNAVRTSSQFDNSTVPNNQESPNSDTYKINMHNLSPLHLNEPSDSPRNGTEIKHYLSKVVEEVGIARKNLEQQDRSALSSPHPGNELTDKEWLTQFVHQIKLNKPYLRNDDKNLLDFLCEKEGTAFESEIRNKFILPRTSLWRLIKRLEREELVEVTKIGGQNLIKLRFEEKSN